MQVNNISNLERTYFALLEKIYPAKKTANLVGLNIAVEVLFPWETALRELSIEYFDLGINEEGEYVEYKYTLKKKIENIEGDILSHLHNIQCIFDQGELSQFVEIIIGNLKNNHDLQPSDVFHLMLYYLYKFQKKINENERPTITLAVNKKGNSIIVPHDFMHYFHDDIKKAIQLRRKYLKREYINLKIDDEVKNVQQQKNREKKKWEMNFQEILCENEYYKPANYNILIGLLVEKGYVKTKINNNYEWVKSKNALKGLIKVFLDQDLIRSNYYSGPDFKKIFHNTFGIDVDASSFQLTELNNLDEAKYKRPFEQLLIELKALIPLKFHT